MAIKMVRAPSETPNIQNTDDIAFIRYAYGNQNGYVKSKGNEISAEFNSSTRTFKIKSGRIVLQGVECDIDGDGVSFVFDQVNEDRYYVIYCEVNLGLNTATLKSTYGTSTYPTISDGADLTHNTTGTANLVIYKVHTYNGLIQEHTYDPTGYRVAKEIEYLGQLLTRPANSISYTTTQPIANNTDGGLKVYVGTMPNERFGGWLYLITES